MGSCQAKIMKYRRSWSIKTQDKQCCSMSTCCDQDRKPSLPLVLSMCPDVQPFLLFLGCRIVAYDYLTIEISVGIILTQNGEKHVRDQAQHKQTLDKQP